MVAHVRTNTNTHTNTKASPNPNPNPNTITNTSTKPVDDDEGTAPNIEGGLETTSTGNRQQLGHRQSRHGGSWLFKNEQLRVLLSNSVLHESRAEPSPSLLPNIDAKKWFQDNALSGLSKPKTHAELLKERLRLCAPTRLHPSPHQKAMAAIERKLKANKQTVSVSVVPKTSFSIEGKFLGTTANSHPRKTVHRRHQRSLLQNSTQELLHNVIAAHNARHAKPALGQSRSNCPLPRPNVVHISHLTDPRSLLEKAQDALRKWQNPQPQPQSQLNMSQGCIHVNGMAASVQHNMAMAIALAAGRPARAMFRSTPTRNSKLPSATMGGVNGTLNPKHNFHAVTHSRTQTTHLLRNLLAPLLFDPNKSRNDSTANTSSILGKAKLV